LLLEYDARYQRHILDWLPQGIGGAGWSGRHPCYKRVHVPWLHLALSGPLTESYEKLQLPLGEPSKPAWAVPSTGGCRKFSEGLQGGHGEGTDRLCVRKVKDGENSLSYSHIQGLLEFILTSYICSVDPPKVGGMKNTDGDGDGGKKLRGNGCSVRGSRRVRGIRYRRKGSIWISCLVVILAARWWSVEGT